MADIIELLQHIGFGDYEAQAYVALLRHGPATGYGLAKTSGIPRPNVYNILQKLEDRGAVIRLDTEDATRYAPVAPDELLARIGGDFQETLDTARERLERLASPVEYAEVVNVRGYSMLLAHAQSLIEGTDEDLLVAVWPDEALALADSMSRAEERGIEVTTLCMAACPQECGGCRGNVYRYRVVDTAPSRWLMVVPDRDEMLAGEIVSREDTQAIRTRQRLLVDLTTWFIRHSIALATILNDLGDRLEELLSPASRAALETVGPVETAVGWLDHMRRLIRVTGPQPPDRS